MGGGKEKRRIRCWQKWQLREEEGVLQGPEELESILRKAKEIKAGQSRCLLLPVSKRCHVVRGFEGFFAWLCGSQLGQATLAFFFAFWRCTHPLLRPRLVYLAARVEACATRGIINGHVTPLGNRKSREIRGEQCGEVTAKTRGWAGGRKGGGGGGIWMAG